MKTMPNQGCCVVGIGNPLLSDDTVGLLAARRVGELSRREGLAVCVCEQHGWGLDLLDPLEGRGRALIIDSIMTGNRKPGEFVVLSEGDLAGGGFVNAHGFSLPSLLDAGRRTGFALPSEVRVLAVEVRNVSEFSEQPTQEVLGSLDDIVARAMALVRSWCGPASSKNYSMDGSSRLSESALQLVSKEEMDAA